ncbi:MAG: hypothetical protein JNK48_34985 [Bryobacterales bacterium]|nr:hypothetical protein [Bryobacterales bacterium]
MPRNVRLLCQTLTALFLVSFLAIFGNVVIPPAGKTGAPGDGTCAECHVGTPNNQGSVLIDFGQLAYNPGKKQRLRVHVLATNTPVLTGFQLTARLASDETQQAGEFQASGPVGLQLKDGIQYVNQVSVSGATVYSFDWTPPPAGSGDVKFYVSAVTGTGNGIPDPNVYTSAYTLPAAQRDLTGGYRWISFDYPGATRTRAVGINESGATTGSYYLPDNNARGFVRDSNGGLTSFTVPGAKETMPHDINSGGQIVGTYIDTSNVTHGFIRSPIGAFTTFDVPGASNPTILTGVSDASTIVGHYIDNSGRQHGIAQVTPPNFQTLDVDRSATYITGISGGGALIGGIANGGGSVFQRTNNRMAGLTMCEPLTAIATSYFLRMNDLRDIVGNCVIPTITGSNLVNLIGAENGRYLRLTNGTSFSDVNNSGQIAAYNASSGLLLNPCLVSPVTLNVSVGPAAGAHTLSTSSQQADCRANAISEASWITVGNPQTGSVSYTVAENNTGVVRTGVIWVAGFSVTVTQQAGACDFLIAAPTTIGAEGGFITLNLTGPQSCSWNPRSSGDWVSFSSTSGSGNGSVVASFSANFGAFSRTTVISIGTTQYLVTQAGAAGCGYTVTPLSVNMPANGGSTVISVFAAASCGWSVTNPASWVFVQAGFSGAGNGTVTIFVNANGDFNARSTTLQIANQTVIVTQAGTGGGFGAALRFVPVAPCRVADTRDGAKPFPFGTPRMGQNTSRDFAIPQSGCGIPVNARAYSLNITAVPPGPLAYITAYPTGSAQPLVSTLNSFDGRVVANAAIVPAGVNGAISLYVSNDTDVVMDINGYFTTADDIQGLAFYPVAPCRIADTRQGSIAGNAYGAPSIPGGGSRTIPIAGAVCNIPANARAFSLNATAVPQGYLGFLTVYPSEQTLPATSTLNSWNGQVVANAAIVPAGASGGVQVYASNTTDVVLDINGYFAPPGFAGQLNFYTLNPCRVADTRLGSGKSGSYGPPRLEAGTSREIPVPFSGCGAPTNALAYSVNVTAVPPGPLSYITAYPTGTSLPLVSTLNSFNGQVVANAALVPAGTNGSISFFAASPTELVLDINGYFAP